MRKALRAAVLTAAALLCAAASHAAPSQVVIIRHAEKTGYDNELSEQGFKRARALVRFFASNPAVTRYGPPAAVYAAAPKHEDSSIRSIQTVTPLAEALGLKIKADYTRGQVGKLVRDIMENPAYEGRMVLVCWQHGAIPDIALELARYNGSAAPLQFSLPQSWPDEDFDRAWVLDLTRGKVISFKDIPQRLLPGDSSK